MVKAKNLTLLLCHIKHFFLKKLHGNMRYSVKFTEGIKICINLPHMKIMNFGVYEVCGSTKRYRSHLNPNRPTNECMTFSVSVLACVLIVVMIRLKRRLFYSAWNSFFITNFIHNSLFLKHSNVF